MLYLTSCWDDSFKGSLGIIKSVPMPNYLMETGTIYHVIARHNMNPVTTGEKMEPTHLLISVAMMVILCHTLSSLSSGVASVIFPSSALMLNCLSRSVCRSMENLQNTHICNLLQCWYDPYVPQQTFSNPWRAMLWSQMNWETQWHPNL